VPSEKQKVPWAKDIFTGNTNFETGNTREGEGNGEEGMQGEGRSRTRMPYTTALYTTPFLHLPKRTKLLTPPDTHQNVHAAKSCNTMFLGELQSRGSLEVVSSYFSSPLQNDDGHGVQFCWEPLLACSFCHGRETQITQPCCLPCNAVP